MNIAIERRKCELTAKEEELIVKKFKKLDKFFVSDSRAELKLSAQRNQKIAEVTVRDVQMVYRAQATAADFVSATEAAVDHIERRIFKHKSRLEKRLREGAFERQAQAEPTDYSPIRYKSFALKPITEEEAILQMEMLNHRFYLFKNADRGDGICVVYLRDDGGYGVIEGV